MPVYELLTTGRVLAAGQPKPAGAQVFATIDTRDVRAVTGGVPDPEAEGSGGGGGTTPGTGTGTTPDPDTGGSGGVPGDDVTGLELLTENERQPGAGNSTWTAHTGTTLTATSAGWLLQNPDGKPRMNTTREPFPVPAGEVTVVASAADGEKLTVGIDWFSSGPTYISSTIGTMAAGKVVAQRPAGATLGKPFVQGITTPTTVTGVSMKVDENAAVEPPPPTGGSSTGGGTGTPGTLAAGGSVYSHYDDVYGNTIYADKLPPQPPYAKPSDKFWAGREIKRQATSGYSPTVNIKDYSVPVWVVDSSDPAYPETTVRHRNRRGFGSVDRWGNDIRNYLKIPMKGNERSAGGTDGSIAFYDVATGRLWEMWQYEHGDKSCEWMGYIAHMPSNIGQMEVGSCVAAAVPGTALQLGIDEMLAGQVNHAVGLELPKPGGNWQDYSWPARQSDGLNGNTAREGQFLQLDPSFDTNTLRNNFQRIVGKAMQEYGAMVLDKSGCVAARGESPVAWQARTGQGDPWPGIFGGEANWSVWNGFPWDRLIALPKDYRRP